MAQVHADPEDIRTFALQLQAFDDLLADAMLRLNGQFARLGDTWLDPEHAAFADEFLDAMRVLHRFLEVSRTQVPFLQTKAALLDEYLRHRR